MVKHPVARRSVAKIREVVGGRTATLPTYAANQDARFDQPAEFLVITECLRLRDAGLGEFINRGRAFRRWAANYVPPSGRQREMPRHWRSRNGALQLVPGPEPGRAGHFSYPVPPRVNPNHRGCRCGQCERVSQER